MRNTKLILVLILIAESIFAQTDTTKKSALTFGAFVDAYYAYSFNNPTSKNIDFAYNHSRHNEFNVNLALISAKYSSKNMRGNLALQTGTYVQFNYAAEPTALQNIYDANVGVRLYKSWWLDAGIFGSSHIGFESAISKDNWTLTRSMSAENTPYYASGAELNYEPSEKFLFSIIAVNGWQVIKDNNSNKSFGYQLTWKPNSKFGINTSSFFGEAYNRPDSMGALLRYFNHLYLYYHPTKKISMALLFDVGLQQTKVNGAYDASWINPTFLFKVTPSAKWAFCVRGEYYDDSKNIVFTSLAGTPFKTFGTSLNFDYTGIDNVVLRIEGKQFISEKDVYTTKTGFSKNSTILTTSIAWWF